MTTRSAAFRSLVFILPLLAVSLSMGAAEQGFVSVFNGKNLAGWAGDSVHWSVEDGAITGKTTPATELKANTFLVYQGGKPGDFEFKCQYKIVGGNSGVQYRSKLTDETTYVVKGYQADIDSTPGYTGLVYEEGGRGFLAERGQKVVVNADGKKTIDAFADKADLQKKVKIEDWNNYLIVAKGNHLKHVINGVVMSEVTDEESSKAAESGVIALQLHAGPPMTVQFKNLELKQTK